MNADSHPIPLERLPTEELIFDALRRVFISAAEIENIREFDTRFFILLKEVAGGGLTLFPGLADAITAVTKEVTLTTQESNDIAKMIRNGMERDREVARRLTAFLMKHPVI